MKASPLLRAWLAQLTGLGVVFHGGARWIGFDGSAPRIEHNGRIDTITADATILALGGASWPELGADGAWVAPLRAAGVALAPLLASNAGVWIDWTAPVAALAGAPLKRVDVLVGQDRFAGEAVLTATGLEGQAIYAAGAAIRAGLGVHTPLPIALDLQPNRTRADLAARLGARNPKRTLAAFLVKSCGLSPAGARLVLAHAPDRAPDALAAAIKACQLQVRAMAPIARAISTAGGLAFEALDEALGVRALPGVFACGEMLDWDAPTGGYLLQACLSTAVAAANAALSWRS
jgi:hypothetical protein